MKKKILIVTEALEMNGVLRSLLDFMEALDKSRFEIDLFCFDAHKPDFVELPAYVNLLSEDPWCYMARAPLARICGWALRNCAFVPLLKRLVISVFQGRWPKRFVKTDLTKRARRLKGEYDVVCAYSMGMTWRFVDEKVQGKKKLYWIDTDVRFNPWKGTWDKYAKHLGLTGVLVCVGEAIREMMTREFPDRIKKSAVIHNVVDASTILKKSGADLTFPKKGKFRIVTIGRYCPQKNQVMIPKIAQALRDRGLSDFEWIMAGPGAAGYRTDDPNLVYLDSQSNPYPLMKSADLYVQPSTYEGWGLTLSEALCLGRCVVASDIPAFREQIKSDAEGILVECTPEAFAAAILSFVSSPRPGMEIGTYHRFDFASNRKEFENAIG